MLRSMTCLLAGLLFATSARGAELAVRVVGGERQPLAHAVVSLHNEHVGGAVDPEPEVMDQRDRQFKPHVLAVQKGTPVRFPNSDNIRHHVYSFSSAKRFELRLYHGSTAEPVLFDQPGKVALGCNIHDAMLGYIYVLDSPWFGVSAEDGVARIEALPAGDYRLRVQHPRLAEPTERSLTLTAEQSAELTVELGPLQPDPRRKQPDSELERLFRE